MRNELKEYVTTVIVCIFALFGFIMAVHLLASSYLPSRLEAERKDQFIKVCLQHHTPNECGLNTMTRDYWLVCVGSKNKLSSCGNPPTED